MQVLVSDMYKYTVTEDDRGRSLYLSSPDGDLCSLGQRVIVEVDAGPLPRVDVAALAEFLAMVRRVAR